MAGIIYSDFYLRNQAKWEAEAQARRARQRELDKREMGDSYIEPILPTNLVPQVVPVTVENPDGSITTTYNTVIISPPAESTLQTGVASGMTSDSYQTDPPVEVNSIDNPAKIIATDLPSTEYNSDQEAVEQAINNDVYDAASVDNRSDADKDAFANSQIEQSINNDVFNAADNSPYGETDAIKAMEAQMGLPIGQTYSAIPDKSKPPTIVTAEQEREILKRNNYSFSIKQDTKVRLFAPRGRENAIYGHPDKFNNILTILHSTQGIVFPYTPTITETQNVEYAQTSLVSSNQDYYAYKTTGSTKITVAGDFVLENQYDAEYMLAVVHFFRVMAKSHFGKRDTTKAGLPPPILNFSGYGKYMYDHLPVIITSRTLPFDGDIDWIDVVDGQGYVTKVPKKFNLSLELTVQNTPRKLREEFNLDEFRTGQLMRQSKGWI